MQALDCIVKKRVVLAPFNNISINLARRLNELDLTIVGFLDLTKRDKNVFGYDSKVEYDYVIVSSPNFWREIITYFPPLKVLIYQASENSLLSLFDYQEQLSVKAHYDVLLIPFNKSNVMDLALVSRQLSNNGISSALVNIGADIDSNLAEGFKENDDVDQVSQARLENITKHVVLTSIDWGRSFIRPYIRKERLNGIITAGVVDGIEDFEDSDYKNERNAYRTVEYVFTMGVDDQKFLKDKISKTNVVGLPKLFSLYQEKVVFPQNDLVVINVNFTYGSHENARDNWLKQVIAACESLKLDYVISQHHADTGKLANDNISSYSAYDTLRQGSILVSRFSTLILESLVLGKPVVYFNPHQEKVKLYKEPLGAFSVAYSQRDLVLMLRKELSQKENTRLRAKEFLDNKCNISCRIAPAKLIADKVSKWVGDLKE